MENKIQLSEQGLEEYPIRYVVTGNLAIALWIGLGTFISWTFHPIAGWLYLIFAVVMVVFVLRKLLCTNCYYYGKRCSMGWGKVSAWLFKKGRIKHFNKGSSQSFGIATYNILTIVPVILIIVSMVLDFEIIKVAALALFLTAYFWKGKVVYKKACSQCKMRFVCRLSAAQQLN